MRMGHTPSLLSACKTWGVFVMKMQDQQQVVLLVQEALGEKMAKNMQKKVCQTIG